jgi:hypothetical protein
MIIIIKNKYFKTTNIVKLVERCNRKGYLTPPPYPPKASYECITKTLSLLLRNSICGVLKYFREITMRLAVLVGYCHAVV